MGCLALLGLRQNEETSLKFPSQLFFFRLGIFFYVYGGKVFLVPALLFQLHMR